MKKLIVIALLFNYLLAAGQNTLNLAPMPAEVKMGKGVFSINKNTLIVIEGKKHGQKKIKKFRRKKENLKQPN